MFFKCCIHVVIIIYNNNNNNNNNNKKKMRSRLKSVALEWNCTYSTYIVYM